MPAGVPSPPAGFESCGRMLRWGGASQKPSRRIRNLREGTGGRELAGGNWREGTGGRELAEGGRRGYQVAVTARASPLAMVTGAGKSSCTAPASSSLTVAGTFRGPRVTASLGALAASGRARSTPRGQILISD